MLYSHAFPPSPKPVSETRLGSRRLRHLWNSEGAIKIMTPRDTIFWDAPPPTKKVHHHLMEIEDPQGERDSPEALISHAWETEERSSLRSAFRISLPWDAPALLAWRTVAPAPPRWRTGRTSGPLLVSWKFWNFHSLFLSVSLSNCDHKLITKTYNNRLLNSIKNHIITTQTAYLKGRNISDNLRLINALTQSSQK